MFDRRHLPLPALALLIWFGVGAGLFRLREFTDVDEIPPGGGRQHGGGGFVCHTGGVAPRGAHLTPGPGRAGPGRAGTDPWFRSSCDHRPGSECGSAAAAVRNRALRATRQA